MRNQALLEILEVVMRRKASEAKAKRALGNIHRNNPFFEENALFLGSLDETVCM